MKAPRVSIVVPNYNYGQVLPRRLDGIYNQTFQDFEVILLDDASTDGSAAILAAYAERYPKKTRLSVNAKNTGSPFAQWAHGISQAKGELIWMAEADDYAEPHLLQRLVEPFEDPAVVLSYAKPAYVDLDGRPSRFQFAEYVADLRPGKWDAPYVAAGADEVREALGIRNTIPNASAALFRSAAARAHVADPLWQRMKMCGDWCLYLRLLTGGKLAYVGEAGACYAFHEESCAARHSRTTRYLEEHAMVIATIRALFPSTPPETLQRNFDYLLRHFQWTSSEPRPPLLATWTGVEFSSLWQAEDALAEASASGADLRTKAEADHNRAVRAEDKTKELTQQLEQARSEAGEFRRSAEETRGRVEVVEARARDLDRQLEQARSEAGELQRALDETRNLAERAKTEAEKLGGELKAAQQHRDTILAESQRLLARYRQQAVALGEAAITLREAAAALEAERINHREQTDRKHELERKLAETNRMAEALRCELDAFRSSTFWRLTAPARWAVGLWRSMTKSRQG